MARSLEQTYKMYLFLLGALIIILIFSAAQSGLKLRRYRSLEVTVVAAGSEEEVHTLLQEEFQWANDENEQNLQMLTSEIDKSRQEMWGKLAMLGIISVLEIVLFVLFRRKKREQS